VSLRDHLQEIYDRHEGTLTAELVVATAKPSSHPLHDRFEWNDRIAGHKYRLVQASELIRSVKVTYREPDEDEDGAEVRAWHAVREDGRYEPAEKVAADPQISALVLRQMEMEWKSLHRRYGHMAEFISLVSSAVRAAA
jgi:hypothetical protein